MQILIKSNVDGYHKDNSWIGLTKDLNYNQSLVGSVVIDVGFGREDHSSIPRNYNREGAGTT
jgi:hypothetical protein